MTALLRMFGLLLRKNWQVRKRHWVLSLVVQIVLPAIIIFFARVTLDKVSIMKNDPELDSSMNESTIISEKYLGTNVVIYSPMNKFIDELMFTFRDCWIDDLTLLGFPTEEDLIAFDTNSIEQRAGIVFNESTDYSTKQLHYKIRGYLNSRILYKQSGYFDIINIHVSMNPFLQIQICLDKSFIKNKINSTDVTAIPQIYIQRMPFLTQSERLSRHKNMDLIYTVLVMTCFIIPLFIEMSTTANEKFGGVHILMSMNGVPSILNFFSWIISSFMHTCAICVIITIFMFSHLSSDSYDLSNYINPSILFAFFITHNLHMIAFGIHISAYFTKPILVTFAYSMSNMTAIVLYICLLQDYFSYMVPYVGIIFPNMFIIQTIANIDLYKESGIHIQWTNMFENSEPALRIDNSIGMTLIFSIIGMIFHFTLAVYVYATNPGKYGIGRHPLSFFMTNSCDVNCDSIEDCIYDATNEELFEVASGCTAGIQIRNLRKSYMVGIFKRQQVQALRGLSIDFYKGQITTLLGHNGAGKSTLISILTGTIKPTSGIVLINSKILKNNASEILKDVGLCAQEDTYFPSLTVTEQLDFFAKVKKRNRQVVEALLQKLKLSNVKDALPDCLSADQRRKLCLGIAFVGDPSVFILDEPTSRLDHESKRLIWDILLEMKGRKTILVSTHDMHEADLLADRVAIMHEGRLKSYGSPLYLKKMLGGQNNVEITLSIERWSDSDTIRKEIDCEAKFIQIQDKKIVISVSTSSIKSNFLENLEKKKSELGVISYSLSIASLEQVFLRVTREIDSSYEAINSNIIKLKGISLYIQMVRALLYKNMTYALKESSTLLMQILLIFITLVTVFIPIAIFLIMPKQNEMIQVNLELYNNPHTLFTSFDKNIGEQYKRISQLQGGSSVEITNTSLYSELMRRAKEDLIDYNKNLIAAAEFNETNDGYIVNAFYSEEALYSLPISMNLVTNVIIRHMLGDDYSISLSEQAFPGSDDQLDYEQSYHIGIGLGVAVIFVIPLYLLIATFVIRPARESSRGLKHLQKLAGVSGFVYWGTMFLSDMIQYTFLVSLLVIGLTCMDYSFRLKFFGAKEIITMVLLSMLFAISSLPLVYMVSFIKAKTNTLVKLIAFSYFVIGSVEIMVFALLDSQRFKISLLRTLGLFHRRIFFLVPHLNFFHAQIVFYTIGMQNARCRNLPNRFFDVVCKHEIDYCCDLNCYNGECQINLPYSKFEGASLDDCIQFLCMASVIYFCLLAILEARLFQKIKIQFGIKDSENFSADEQILREKSMIFQFIQSLSKRTSENEISVSHLNIALLVYELRKRYRKIKAVEDVSFIVGPEECFGILGVNTAGKTAVLRMITGEEIPDNGTIFMGDKHFRPKNRKFFLSQIGYCRQQEAIIKCLNSYDHLRLFARLRGVPEKFIENEVRIWIERLRLGACACLPTRSYSSGNKQRLNIVIALIGNPQLVLLDEPTIRVDPSARRSFWRTIKNSQATGQTFLLASHNMEECEVLCNRMAIMVEGRLTCIGTPTELKQRFGAGYDVQIRIDPRKGNSQLDGIKNTMRLLLDSKLTIENTGSLLYYVSGPGTTWRRLYDVLNKIKNKYECIDDYIVIVRLRN